MRALAREPVYYQFFCGELSFCHKLPFARSSLTHWRQRLGEEQRSRPHWGDSQARAPGSEDAMHGENRRREHGNKVCAGILPRLRSGARARDMPIGWRH